MAHFSKRHYEALAQVLQSAQREIQAKEPVENQGDLIDGVMYVRDFLDEMLQRDNTLFDRGRFLRACEVGANVKAREA